MSSIIKESFAQQLPEKQHLTWHCPGGLWKIPTELGSQLPLDVGTPRDMSPAIPILATRETDPDPLCSGLSKDNPSRCTRALCIVSNFIRPQFNRNRRVYVSCQVDGSLSWGKRLCYIYLIGISIPAHGHWRAVHLKSNPGLQKIQWWWVPSVLAQDPSSVPSTNTG